MMNRARSTYRSQERCPQGFRGKPSGIEATWKTKSKCIKKWDVGMDWDDVAQDRTGGGHLLMR